MYANIYAYIYVCLYAKCVHGHESMYACMYMYTHNPYTITLLYYTHIILYCMKLCYQIH